MNSIHRITLVANESKFIRFLGYRPQTTNLPFVGIIHRFQVEQFVAKYKGAASNAIKATERKHAAKQPTISTFFASKKSKKRQKTA
jgi:hypothetical protein